MNFDESKSSLAHITEDGTCAQTVKEHLEGTAQLSAEFAKVFGCEEWGYCCGMLHDIGKYSDAFQKHIRGAECRVDHATAGAQLCRDLKGLYVLLAYCIAGHHAGLPDTGAISDDGRCKSMMGRLKKKIEPYDKFRNEIEIPSLKTLPFNSGYRGGEKDSAFIFSMLIRMLFSSLVDADYLDTEKFMQQGNIVVRNKGQSMDSLLKKAMRYVKGWLQSSETDTVNGRRTEILKKCIRDGEKDKDLFSLTVPTGGGKTIASLLFSLVHAQKHHMNRIIYVIPYTSIIEQNAKVFREILGDENVLENHCNIAYEVDSQRAEELQPMQLAAENWDKPVVVTTNVQFFESLFANKPSKCRKLHNIANSVIIFDEAQMLPNDYLKPCIAMIEELLNNYKTSVVLCTATQPALKSFFQSEVLATELCPRMDEQFHFFKRTLFENIGTVTEDCLMNKLTEEYQALCIVNTKKRAQNIYKELKEDGVYHLSTSMYPKHRKRVLNEIRERLGENKKCILISTSLVEAGVDLDFQSVYRELAGVDSMIQAAGRCNREGQRKVEESKVLIFRFEEKENILGQRQQIDVTKSLIADGRNLSDRETITRYFEMLYHIKGESLDKKKIMDEFTNKKIKYRFAQVGKDFRLIEQNTKTVFINCEEEADKILRELKVKGFTRSGMRNATQYCVTVYDQTFDKMYGAGMLKPIAENMEDFYELTDESRYTEEMGLELEIDNGMVLFF